MPKFNFNFGTAGKVGAKPSFGYTFQTPKAIVSTDTSSMDVGARFTPTKPPLVTPKFTVDYSKLTASGKGSWNYELKTPFTDALNAGLVEGLGHIKTSIAGVTKMIAQSTPSIKGYELPQSPQLSQRMDELIDSTETWIKQYQPESMTTFQALAKDLVSGGISIFSSIGIGVLTGGAGSSAVLFGLMQAGDKYVEQVKNRVSTKQAGGISTAQGFVEASLEFIGLDSFLKMRNGKVWNTLIRAGTEAVQEASQSFGENVLDRAWDKNQNLMEGVLRSALIGGLLGLPAAVSVSAYEQSTEYGQAVKRVAELGPEYAKRAEAIVQGIVRSVNEKVVPLVDETLREAQKSITLPDVESTLGIQKKAPLRTTSGMGQLVGQPQTISGGVKPTPKFHIALPSTATPQISPVAEISGERVSVPTPPTETAPQIAPPEIVQLPAAQMEPISKMETPPSTEQPSVVPTVTNTAPLPAGLTTSGQEVTPSYVSNEPDLATSGTSTIPADNETISRMTIAFDQIEEHLGEKKSEVKAVEGTFQQAFATFLKQSGIPKGALSWEQALDWYKASRGEKSFAKRVAMVKRAVEKYNLGIEQKQRTSIITEISSLQAKSKSGVYALAQEELDSLLGKYRKSKLSKKHKASLEASRAYFAEHPDLDLPANLADEIAQLDKETLKGMSVRELTALRERVKGILSSGKEAYREWKKRNDLKQTLYKKSVLARAKSLGGATSENIGTVMTRWQKLYQDALAIDETLEPTDVWMNQLGLMNEKRRFDDKYNHFLLVTRTIKSRVASLMEKNHLTMEDRQKIKLFQIVRMGREDLIAPIAEHLKMTVEQASAIALTEGQKEVLDYMDSQYKAYFPIVQDYLARVKNQTIHQEDFYAPLLADPNALGNDTVESNAVTFYHNTKTISSDSVRAREQLHYLTTSDSVSDFERYVTDMQYMVEMGELTKRLSEVVNSKEFQAKAGVLGQSILSDWLDTMARRGGASGEQRIRILDLLRKNTNTGYMTAKLGTVFVQFTAIADGFNEIGIKWMVAGAERQANPEWRNLMRDFAAEVYGNEADPDFTEPTWWKGLVKGLRTPVVAADAVVRRTVFLGAYARACERLGLAGTVEEFSSSDKEVKQNIREALAEAMQVTRKAQGTSEFKDQPLSISRGRIGNLIKNRSVGKLMTQFQSFNFFRFSNIKDTIWTSGIKRGRLDKALGGIFWLLLVASMSEVLLRRGARWISSGGKTSGEATDKITVGLKGTIEDTFNLDPSWLTQLTAETFSGLVDNIPFMGQLVGMMMYGKDPLPVADAIIKFSQGMGSIVNGASGTTKLRGVAGVVSAGGALMGVPGSAQVGGTLRDVITTKKKPKFKFTLPY